MTRAPARGRSPAPLRALGLALLIALIGLVTGDALDPLSAPAASPFQWRGVIQGQYGPQFGPGERRRLLSFMARNGFNAYVQAPKGDPYQRTLWRDPYPTDRQASFDSEVKLAASLGIEWIPNVSPGIPAWSSPGEAAPPGTSASEPICFSSEADLRQLLAKLEPFRAAGAHTFMVSFDDVQRRFSCDADVSAYGGGDEAFGRANADLLDRLHALLVDGDPGARLLTVTADYEGTGDSDYLRGFRDRLEPGIEVMWTGISTESRPFAPEDADAYAREIGRTPIVWENWTSNDLLSPDPETPARVFLGPYVRRADVVGHVGGFFFNPANQAALNFLPLATAGTWMRNPDRYRPRRAFLHAVRKLAGHQARALRAFAEASYSTTLSGGVEAPTLNRRIHRLLVVGAGNRRHAAHRLRLQLHLAANARRPLLRVRGLRPFVRQARPILRSVRLNARAGLLATDLLMARRSTERRHLRQRLRRAQHRAARWPSETFGTRFGLYGMTGNVIDAFADRVRHRDRHRHARPGH
jgi:hyaluronoglucosaminidase